MTGAARLRFTVRLAARQARSPAIALATGPVLVAGIFLMAMFAVLESLTFSGSQVAERDLGRFGASVGYGAVLLPPGRGRVTDELRSAATRAGASDVTVVTSATDVQLRTARGEVRDVTLQEAPWASGPFPDRFTLRSGRWPRRAGEVVVSDPEDVGVRATTSLPVFGGRAHLRVVGTAEDRYARTSTLLAAPGTWAALPRTLARAFGELRAQPALYWAGNAEPRVIEAVARVAQAHHGANAVAQTVMRRRDVVATTPEKAWLGRSPAGYWVPSLLLPFAAFGLTFGLLHRRFRRTIGILTSVGVGRRTAVVSVSAAAGAWGLAAVVAGGAIGTALGITATRLVAHLRGLPAGPLEGVDAALMRLVAVVALAAVVAGPALLAPARATARDRADGARKLLAFAAWCAVLRLSFGVASPAGAAVLAGVLALAVVLVVPEIVETLLRALPERGPRMRLGRRQLADDHHRAAAAIALLAVILGGSLGYVTLLDTMVATAEDQAEPDVLPGQLLVMNRSSRMDAPSRQLVETVRRSAGGRPGFQVRFLNKPGGTPEFESAVFLAGVRANVMALDSVDQVAQLVGHPLDAAQAAALSEGGMLVWDDAGPVSARGQLELVSHERSVRAVAVALAPVAVADTRWRAGSSGVLLTETARRARLPVTPGPVMYTGLSEPAGRAVQDAVVDAGLDGRMILRGARAPRPIPPAALVATAVGLVALALLGTLAAIRGQARTLRGYLGRLIAIGLPVGWARRVLLYQLAVIVAAATALALVIALPPVIITAARIQGFTLSVPWAQIGLLVLAIYLATCLAALQATRTLRAV